MREDVIKRAETVAEMAPGDSVTAGVLAGYKSRFSESPPLNNPPLTYLDGAEAPAYLLTNGKRGIGRGTKRKTDSPVGDRRTVILVTGRRTLCLIGKAEDDDVIEIPHESVADVTTKSGFRAHRLALRTPRKMYHCWVHRKTDKATLNAAAEFIETHQQDRPDAIDGDDTANRVMYRGRPVAPQDTTHETEDSDQTTYYRGQPIDDDSD
ncbi:hypothetical protein BVU17_02955 [Haloarcula taiwanensis]|uniref:Uncharacterized protein n=1 Tax=Haloarcula taiwanensis TaxID=1932004 RepID=A0A2H4ZVL9_9EURY|nr:MULTISPECIES: PH domain-containing protein [Haloarcula]AUG46526.1 hypothetical protein BVU17_02955 [Haloarcula taiwanensis]RLM36726.1 hypothetical protein DVK01_08905 [Haloarcula sp. Atlit-120R]RLM44883.1 hypothetical protein DVK00_10545 [Haloarcula sp. Atlit-47R]